MIAAQIFYTPDFDLTEHDQHNADALGLSLLNYQSRRDTLLEFLNTGEEFTEENYKAWLRKINDDEMALVRGREHTSAMVMAYGGDDELLSAPPLAKQARSFVRAMASHARSGLKNADKEMILKRQEICRSCEQLGKDGAMKNRCHACGCFMLVKARWQTSKCTLGKW